MNQYHNIILLFVAITLFGCGSQSQPTPTPAPDRGLSTTKQPTGEATPANAPKPDTATPKPDPATPNEDGSLPLTEAEKRELSEPDANPYSSAERELAFLRGFKLGQSLAEVRKNVSTKIKLKQPTTEIPIGELDENTVVVEFTGDLHGFFYFQGTPQSVGKLNNVEVFTGDGSYANGVGKQRIRSFNKLLGKPLELKKFDDDGAPIYFAQWQDGERRIAYADIYEWGAVLILKPEE
ncbi:MAG: hypothetical protein AB1489_05655 [Acidobacteriota bacterium]